MANTENAAPVFALPVGFDSIGCPHAASAPQARKKTAPFTGSGSSGFGFFADLLPVFMDMQLPFRHQSAYQYMKLEIRQLPCSREENKDGKQTERTGLERTEPE